MAIKFVGLVVLIMRHDPDKPLLVMPEMELPLAVAVVGEPVSIMIWVPVPARSKPYMVLTSILTVDAVEPLLIPVHTPVVAFVLAPLTVLPVIEMVFVVPEEPLWLSMAVQVDAVAPVLRVTWLFEMVALALVAVFR